MWPAVGRGFLLVMASNITEEQFWGPDSPLPEPHFIEEATVLSARPVVPITDLPSNGRFSRPWVFGIALAGAVLLGVAATALYYSRLGAAQSEPVSPSETVSSGVYGASAPVAIDKSSKEASKSSTRQRSEIDPDGATAVNVTPPLPPAPAHSDSSSFRPANSANATAKKPTPRPAILVEEISGSEEEIRQERRAARRDARDRNRENGWRREGRKHSDELLRIRDIFEGPARP